ncbi:MAG: MBL fold metallo-hydrolase [Dehalococcoidales bacterium]|nr:MBL fold metallo-hydrolase [Dehalococcoidales bacterium]
MKEILPGIYQLVLPLPGFNPDTMNMYLLRDKDGYTIIDTGWDTQVLVRSVHDQLSEFDMSFSDIKRILITHCHRDHLGMIGRYKKENNACIYLHQNEIELMKIRFSQGDKYWPMTEAFLQTNGMPSSELTPTGLQLPAVFYLPDPDIVLHGGEVISVGDYRLKVINTPGHTPGHCSYYEQEKKLLFSGDVLLPTIDTNAALHVQHIQNPIRQYLDSILALKEIEVDLVLPGHEDVFSGHCQRIDAIVQHNIKKSQDVFKLFRDSTPKTSYEISKLIALSADKKTDNWIRLSGWDKRFAVLQTTAHLDELAYAGRLTKSVRDGTIYYQKPG